MLSGVVLTFIASTGSVASAEPISSTDFETCNLSGWDYGSQTGNLGSTISGSGTGVTLINSSVTFNAPSGWPVGDPETIYYQPATDPATWVFSPYGSCAAALQPKNQANFDQATTALGLSSAENTAMKTLMSSQAQASGWGSGEPTDAAWITKTVTLTADTVYTMSWNYIGTDYVPYNDGSITSLVTTSATSGASVTVNNQVGSYALLGFTNPGTGDYSTGTYGSTGWQISTYEVSQSGDYVLGFAVFNLDDTALSPVLLVDSQPGGTTKNGDDFGAVAPNNPDAPTVPPATTQPPATDPPATDAPVTDPPATDPPATDAPTTDAPVDTDPPATDAPVDTDPPATDAPVDDEETTTTTTTTTEVERPDSDPVIGDETTTTTTVASTTTAPETTTTTTTVVDVPTTVVVDTSGGSNLPVTGRGSKTLAMIGFVLSGAGLFIISFERKQRAARKRMQQD